MQNRVLIVMAHCYYCDVKLTKEDSGFFKCPECGIEVAPENISEKQ